MSEQKEPTIKKASKQKEKKYPEGIEAKMDGFTTKDCEVMIKMICLNSGMNQLLTQAGFKSLPVADAGNLVRKK